MNSYKAVWRSYRVSFLIFVEQIFINTLHSDEQKNDLICISAHPHFSLSCLLTSPVLFSFHSKLPDTYCVYFYPQLYILFIVLSNYSSSFVIAYPGWLSASEVPLSLLSPGSRARGAAFRGPGYDADKDKLNRNKKIYILMTVPILPGKGMKWRGRG